MKENLPVLLLKKLTLLPLQEVRLELNNDLSKKIIDLSEGVFHNKILVILPINFLEVSPSVKDLPKVGILTSVVSKIELPNGNYRVVIKGLHRVEVLNYSTYKDDQKVIISSIKRLYIDTGENTEGVALKRKLIDLTKSYIRLNPEVSNSISHKINESVSLDELTDLIVNFINLPINKKTIYMNELSEVKRAKKLIKELNIELEVIKLNNKLDYEIRNDFEKEQKDYLLKAKIQKLNEELGVSSSKTEEASIYHDKINNLDVCNETKEKLLNELRKYEYTPDNSPDLSIIRNYIETVISLPFNKSSKEELKAKNIRTSLDKTHYGVSIIKERIEEYAALKELNNDISSPILCFVGPPGVGKTTLAMSISKALKREFFKISVGGLNDSSELTGHRRTYLGASPGKIISGIKKVGVDNPVILIDEVDKMVKDFKGDPASVLLDILDVNQNKLFVDNYIEEPFDLSKVLFILTANDEEVIPAPLKDRLEIIHLDSYTIYDKKYIALNYLIPNIFIRYGARKVKISEDIILYIISNYTLESGVRELERVLDKLIRNIIINKITPSKITLEYVSSVLGNKLYETVLKEGMIGSVNILGASPLGGEIINVGSALVSSDTTLTVTGNVGERLLDSINLIISYLKSVNYIDSKILKNSGLHLHFESNFKIDGYSGALGIISGILSLISKKKIDNTIAFIGSIDLYGNVLKVSKLKDKIITAYNNGIKTIYLPKANIIDLKDIPKFIIDDLSLITVSKYDEVYKKLFLR
ncbi:MAG: AAA family ATPase [Bacilli bacterium]|nr:AAA family ATPase [Bacilli bacterium]MDD4795067.1 AAA family ATPase [Bacilli bacterium]